MNAKPDVRDLLRDRPMATAQIVAVALCTVINMMDGFDILAASFTAPDIARDWALLPKQLGMLFSSGLAGMTVGALALSPLADHWGRRRTVLLALLLVTVGMLSSAAAQGLEFLVATRVITGMGVGAMMPTINTVVAEFSNTRRRDLAICLQSAGFPLGAALGAIAVYFLPDLSWRWVFVAGGGFSILLILAVLAWMPESVDFLIERRPPNALARLNQLLRKFGVPPIEHMPENSPLRGRDAARAAPWKDLMPSTLLICGSFFLLMFTFYFLMNWTPKLLVDYGLSIKAGISGAVLMNIGGVVGDLVFAALMLRWRAPQVGPIFMGLCFATAAIFAFIPMRLDLLTPVALLLGFLLFGSMSSLYAFVPTLYPATLRATGTGLALGLGRIGATAGPYVGGVLISMGWDRVTYLQLMALPLLACAGLTLLLARRQHPR